MAATGQKLVIFASGAGSNARAIIDYFQNRSVEVALIVCNKPSAGVLTIAEEKGIKSCIFHKDHNNWPQTFEEIKAARPDLIVLAGYLLKIPADLIANYPIINIHPALLPKYGGKGMYGNNVHEAVIAANEQQSGITIHYVDEHYDNGAIIVQARCKVAPGETSTDLANRIHKLEHFYYPRTIEYLLGELN